MATRGAIICMTIVLCVMLYVVYQKIEFMHYAVPTLEATIDQARSMRFRLVIDVRTPKEREELGYYPNSIPIAVDQLKKEVPFLIGSGLQSLQSPILVYSNGDRRAQLAAEMLHALGYTQVRYISKSYLSLMPGSQ
jgi:rhodanese-related sulfurtransferase